MGLFSGKPDHPMADAREAKRLLEALPSQDPLKAVEELAHWMESLGGAEGFKPADRLQRLFAVDEAAQPRLRKLARDYLGAAPGFQKNRLWTQIHEYWRQAGSAYARCMESSPGQLPLLLVRALRAVGQQIKWMRMRYGPVDQAAWGALNGAYALAEQRKLADARVTAYPGMPETTSRQEFLKAAIFNASSPDSLLPLQVELAERLIGDFAAGFVLAGAPAPELPYFVDLAKAVAPQRGVKPPEPAPGLRFLGAGAALASLQALVERIAKAREVPAEVNLGGSYEPEVVLEVVRHLITYWSPLAPERKHPRHSVKSKLSVTHGFDAVLGALGGTGGSLDFGTQGGESWVVENVSAGGFGAIAPQAKGDWLRVGALVAMQPEGGSNWVLGAVRRVNRISPREARVGIRTLSRAPVASTFAMGTVAEPGVVLNSEPTGEAAIALRAGVFAPGQNLEAERAGHQHVYMPLGVVERDEDYEIVRYREMVRES
jgi:hypothetical protein